MALFNLRKLIPEMCMRSHRMGLDVCFLDGSFVYCHTSCVRTVKVLVSLRGCDKYHNLTSWLIFSSTEPKAHRWAYRIGGPLLSVGCLSVIHTLFTCSPQKPQGWLKPWDWGTKICSIGPGHAIPKNLKKVFFFGTERLMTLKLGMQHQVLEYYKIYSNDDPGLTLTYIMAKSNLVPYAFVWEKSKTMAFSETIVIYDLKLTSNDQSDKKFLLTSKLCPLGAMPPATGIYTCIKSWKKLIKSDLKEISLNFATYE